MSDMLANEILTKREQYLADLRSAEERAEAWLNSIRAERQALEGFIGGNGNGNGHQPKRRGRKPGSGNMATAAATPRTDIEPSLIDLHGVKPRSLREYVVLILHNAQDSVSVNKIKGAVQAAGYQSSAAKFDSIVYSALNNLKTEKLADRDKSKREGRTAFYKLTSKGEKFAQELLASAGAPQEAAAPTEQGEQTAETEERNPLGNLEHYTLYVLQESNEPQPVSALVTKILDKGYQTKNIDNFANSVNMAIGRLKKNDLIKVQRQEGRTNFYMCTPKGKRFKVA